MWSGARSEQLTTAFLTVFRVHDFLASVIPLKVDALSTFLGLSI